MNKRRLIALLLCAAASGSFDGRVTAARAAFTHGVPALRSEEPRDDTPKNRTTGGSVWIANDKSEPTG